MINHLLNRGGSTLHAATAGRLDSVATPLLLVHPYPLSGTFWRPVADALSGDRGIIVPDLRGFGRSTLSSEDRASGVVPMSTHAEDLTAWLSHLGIDRPVVYVGVSMAGYVAWELIAAAPDRLAGVMICSSRARDDSEAAVAKRLEIVEQLSTRGVEVAIKTADRLVGETTLRLNPKLLARLRAEIRTADSDGLAAAQRGMASRRDHAETARVCDTPLHFVGGDEDAFTKAAEIADLAAACDAGFSRVSHAGHLVPLEQTDQFLGILRTWLKDRVDGRSITSGI